LSKKGSSVWYPTIKKIKTLGCNFNGDPLFIANT
jgi:hypothetical protein